MHLMIARLSDRMQDQLQEIQKKQRDMHTMLMGLVPDPCSLDKKEEPPAECRHRHITYRSSNSSLVHMNPLQHGQVHENQPMHVQNLPYNAAAHHVIHHVQKKRAPEQPLQKPEQHGKKQRQHAAADHPVQPQMPEDAKPLHKPELRKQQPHAAAHHPVQHQQKQHAAADHPLQSQMPQDAQPLQKSDQHEQPLLQTLVHTLRAWADRHRPKKGPSSMQDEEGSNQVLPDAYEGCSLGDAGYLFGEDTGPALIAHPISNWKAKQDKDHATHRVNMLLEPGQLYTKPIVLPHALNLRAFNSDFKLPCMDMDRFKRSREVYEEHCVAKVAPERMAHMRRTHLNLGHQISSHGPFLMIDVPPPSF